MVGDDRTKGINGIITCNALDCISVEVYMYIELHWAVLVLIGLACMLVGSFFTS